jgi:hypothetical protein
VEGGGCVMDMLDSGIYGEEWWLRSTSCSTSSHYCC